MMHTIHTSLGATLHYYVCQECKAEEPAAAYGTVRGEVTSVPPHGWLSEDIRSTPRPGYSTRVYYCRHCSVAPEYRKY